MKSETKHEHVAAPVVVAPEVTKPHAMTAQHFFETLAAECRLPHYGEGAREYTRVLLIRAEEAHLYVPKKDNT